MILTTEAIRRLLTNTAEAAPIAIDGVFSDAKAMLFQNGIAESVNLVLADLQECNFTGYARSGVLVWGAVFNSIDTGLPVLPADQKMFSCSGGTPQNVAGYALVSNDIVPILLLVRVLDSVIEIGPGNSIGIEPRYGMEPVANVPAGDVTIF